MAGEKGGKKGEGQGVCVGEGGKYIIYSHGNIYENVLETYKLQLPRHGEQ